MMNNIPKFEDLPSLLMALHEKIESIDEKISCLVKPDNDTPVWFDVKGLREYLPSHPSTQTIYGWCSSGTIPYHKAGTNGKQNLFLKSEIDEWLIARANRSDYMLSVDAQNYINNKRNG